MGERPEGHTLDRIDGTKGYSKENCRWVKQDIQMHNRSIDHSTEYAGVHYYKATGKYQAYITRYGVKHHLGYFDTPEEAAGARDSKARELYGEQATLNFSNCQPSS
jgi:hypothetical protein